MDQRAIDRLQERYQGAISSSSWENARAFLAREPLSCYVGGKWVGTDHVFPTVDPASGQHLANICEADVELVNQAVEAAAAAFPGWKNTLPNQRAMLLFQLADAIEHKAETFALLETIDTGMLFGTAFYFAKKAADHFRYFAGWATKLEGQTIPVSVPNMLNYTVREPIGVVAGIIPWNMPLLFAAYKIAAPLAFGNTVCLKPAEQTPLTALYLATLVEELNFPPGVINILPGAGSVTGAALVQHPKVAKVSFTGSVETGQLIRRTAADTMKRISLELGGKSPNIILDDADVEKAADGAFSAIYFHQGQVCTAGSRLLIAESVYDEVIEKIVKKAEGLRLGHGLDPATQMGPLISRDQLSRVSSYIESGLSQGAKLRMGGKITAEEGHSDGYFLKPALFEIEGCDRANLAIAKEEIFGPVLVAIKFRTLEEAVEIANDTTFGLAAGIWTRDLAKAHHLASRIQAGTVWINTFNRYDAASPMGGYKMSGLGRELGRASIDLYTEVKSVWTNIEVDK